MNDLTPINTPQWATVVKRLIRMEMAGKDMTYAELSARLLQRFDTHQTENNLKAKVNKGVLSAQLLLQIFCALDMEKLHLGQVMEIYKNVTGNQKIDS